MKLKIINKTKWNTAHLRAFVRKAAQLIEFKPNNICVVFENTRNSHLYNGSSSGHANFFERRMQINIDPDYPDRVDLAYVCGHELGHVNGLSHKQMRGNSLFDRIGRYRELYGWGETLPLEHAALFSPHAKLSKEEFNKRKLAHATAKLKQATTRLKRAQSIVKKWQRKATYYQKKLEV